MKTFRKLLLILGGFALLTSFQSGPLKKSFSLTIKVENLRNDTGVVQFALYNREGTIPDKKFEQYYKIAVSKIDNERAEFTFSDLPPGRYAVNILHDENENGKIDKGLILPKEGIGFSNYEKIGLTNRPRFSKASFEHTSNSTKFIKIIYL